MCLILEPSYIEFEKTDLKVMENKTVVKVAIIRKGNIYIVSKVNYITKQGIPLDQSTDSATENEDFDGVIGSVEFWSGEVCNFGQFVRDNCVIILTIMIYILITLSIHNIYISPVRRSLLIFTTTE